MHQPAAAERAKARFGRKTPFDDPTLVGLFRMIDAVEEPAAKGALAQIARERLRARFPQGESSAGVVELENGLAVEVDLNDVFGAEFFVGHCNESDLLDAVAEGLPKGAVVVDVGANFGLYALLAARLGARVHAFEPAPPAAAFLARNVALNRFERLITIDNRAVSDQAGTASFNVAADGSFSGFTATGRSPSAATIDVETVALDTALADLEKIDFLKIDVEGAEGAVLAGARRLIARSPDILILLEYSWKNLSPADDAAVRRELDSLLREGFRLSALSAGGRPAPVDAVHALDGRFNGSILAHRPASSFGCAVVGALQRTLRPDDPTDLAAAGALLGSLLVDRADQAARADKADLKAEELSQQKDALIAMLETMKARIADGDDRMAMLSRRVDALTAQFEHMVVDGDARFQHLSSQSAALGGELKLLSERLEPLAVEWADFAAEDIKARVLSLEAAAAAARVESEQQRATLKRISEDLAKLAIAKRFRF